MCRKDWGENVVQGLRAQMKEFERRDELRKRRAQKKEERSKAAQQGENDALNSNNRTLQQAQKARGVLRRPAPGAMRTVVSTILCCLNALTLRCVLTVSSASGARFRARWHLAAGQRTLAIYVARTICCAEQQSGNRARRWQCSH